LRDVERLSPVELNLYRQPQVGTNMEFIVTDRASIEHGIRVRSAYVVISIYDPGKREAHVRKQSQSKKQVAAAAARIIPFYEAWGKKDKADEWRKRFATTSERTTP
jgi:hypothetical protein